MEILLIALAAAGLGLGGFILWPAPIDPIAWTPGAPLELTGVLAPNDELRKAQAIGAGRLNFPEDVAFDAQGRMYVGNRDAANAAVGSGDVNARIDRVTFSPDGSYSIEEFVKLPGGGPLDMRFDAAGNLIVASWGQGLISVSPDRQVRTLVADGSLIDGTPFGYADGVAIHPDGRIFFTQGTSGTYSNTRVVQDVLSGRGYGRLLEFTPGTGQIRGLVNDLSFGNGVALAPDNSYVLVADQLRYTIKRFWLTGPNAGREDVFMNNLPGFVHNIFLDDLNVLWIAINRPRNTLADSLAGNTFLKAQLSKLPASLLAGGSIDRNEALRGEGFVLAVDLQGNPLLSLHNPPRSQNFISTAVYHNGYVYVGSIDGGPVIRYRLEQRPQPKP